MAGIVAGFGAYEAYKHVINDRLHGLLRRDATAADNAADVETTDSEAGDERATSAARAAPAPPTGAASAAH